jgi:hypothetical protein
MQRLIQRMKRVASRPRLAVTVAAALAITLFAASSAHAAGRFVYETCDPSLPAGNPPPTVFNANHLIYAKEPDPNMQEFVTCAEPGGSVGIKQVGETVDSQAVLAITIPNTPGGWVESLTLTASSALFHGPEQGEINVTEAFAWPIPGFGDSPRLFPVRSQPPIGSEVGSANILTGIACIGQCEAGAYVASHFIAATEVDPTPPVIAAVEGSLVGGGIVRGHQFLRAHASDIGGGVTSVELKINGIAVPETVKGACSLAAVQNTSYKGIVATSPTPCPPLLAGEWALDTSAAPFQNGMNTVQVCASDFSTNGSPNSSCSNPQGVEVDNSCTESPVAGGTQLSAGFGSDGSDEMTVGFGEKSQITGHLANQTGAPVAGATICLQSRPAGLSTSPPTVGTATTDSQGNFSMEVQPGANRDLVVGYRHDSFQVVKELTLDTRARPTIKLGTHKIHGGRKIKITGTLPGPAAGGHVLVLQGSSERGHTWQTFKKVITGTDGSFSTTYWFSKPKATTGFRVRAEAPEQAGYEYVTGTSRASRIRVRP